MRLGTLKCILEGNESWRIPLSSQVFLWSMPGSIMLRRFASVRVCHCCSSHRWLPIFCMSARCCYLPNSPGNHVRVWQSRNLALHQTDEAHWEFCLCNQLTDLNYTSNLHWQKDLNTWDAPRSNKSTISGNDTELWLPASTVCATSTTHLKTQLLMWQVLLQIPSSSLAPSWGKAWAFQGQSSLSMEIWINSQVWPRSKSLCRIFGGPARRCPCLLSSV